MVHLKGVFHQLNELKPILKSCIFRSLSINTLLVCAVVNRQLPFNALTSCMSFKVDAGT